MLKGLQGGMGSISVLGGMSGTDGGMAKTSPAKSVLGGNDKNKEKKPKASLPTGYDFNPEMKQLGNTKMAFDNDTPVNITKRVAQKMGINPKVLLSSAWVEGMNKAVVEKSSGETQGYKKEFNDPTNHFDKKRFPVDGYAYYGTDTIGDKWDKVKKYLPPGFEQNMQFYNGTNEKGQDIIPAAFNNNENALMAKAALMRYENDNNMDYARKKGVNLDKDAADYFMMAGYNGGAGTAQKMIDEYAKDPDKVGFIKEGRTSKKTAHGHIAQRAALFNTADELLNQPQQ